MRFSFFSKNKSKSKPEPNITPSSSPALVKTECNHKYQDFPPYCLYRYSDDGTYSIQIIEAYVCLYCKKRIDKVLEERRGTSNKPDEEVKKVMRELKNNHPELLEKFEVEDMINDFTLIDREYLYWFHMLHGTQDPNHIEKKEIILKL